MEISKRVLVYELNLNTDGKSKTRADEQLAAKLAEANQRLQSVYENTNVKFTVIGLQSKETTSYLRLVSDVVMNIDTV